MKKSLIMAAVLACFAVSSTLLADTWNKKTKVTFSGPIEIPAPHTSAGVMALPAGSYVFRLIESNSNRHAVEVTNVREDKVYSTILAIPDYRVNASSKTIMYFTERKAGAPTAIKSWFYPGDNFGQRFVYPKVKAAEIAAATNQPVPSHAPEVIEKTKFVAVPVYIQTPAKQEVAYDASAFAKKDATDTAGDDGEAVKAPAEKALPKTGSSLPFVGMMGMLLVAAGLMFRRASSQLS
jgi:LPXTG-motif cell wall-anchored protein